LNAEAPLKDVGEDGMVEGCQHIKQHERAHMALIDNTEHVIVY
jgi:hypothetical protein